jgi:phosphopantetheinyl transferase (holo-ACP synthase)
MKPSPPFSPSVVSDLTDSVARSSEASPRLRSGDCTLHASTAGALRAWPRGRGPSLRLRSMLSEHELDGLAARRNRAEAAAARVLVKKAVRRALCDAGLPRERLPAMRSMQLDCDRFGRPIVLLPPEAAGWLFERALSLDVSLSHEGARVMASAVIGP